MAFNILNQIIFCIIALAAATLSSGMNAANATDCITLAKSSSNYPPSIHIAIVKSDIDFDTTTQKTDLSAQGNQNTYHGHVKTQGREIDVGALSNNAILLDYDLTLRQLSPNCTRIQSIQLTLQLQPSIKIANEYYKDNCWFKELTKHELKHVTKDYEILEKHKGRFKDGLKMILSTPQDYIVSDTDILNDDYSFVPALNILFENMLQDRLYTQAQLDTPHEYHALSRSCERL